MKNLIGKKIFILTMLLITTIVMISCATYVPFMAPGFTGEKLSKGGLAVFPVLIADGSQSIPGIQGYVHSAGGNLVLALREQQPSLKVIGPAQVSAALASNNLVADFAKLKQNYSITGMLDMNLVKKIIKPLNIKYFMLPSVDALFAASKNAAKAQMSGKIYDANSAEMVFETVQSGQGSKLFGGPDYDLAIQNACNNIALTLHFVYDQKVTEVYQNSNNTFSQSDNNFQEETSLNDENTINSNVLNNYPMEATVYLKDGQVIKGTIVNQVPNKSIDIKKADGQTYYYRMDQISKITNGEVKQNKNQTTNYSQSSNYSESSNYSGHSSYSRHSNYSNNSYAQQGKMAVGGQVAVSFPMGDYGNSANTGFGLIGNFLYRMNRNIDITGTLGYLSWSGESFGSYYDNYNFDRSYSDIPLAGGARYYFERKQFSPYAMGELGLHFLGYSVETSSDNDFDSFNVSRSESKTEFGFGIGGGFLYSMGNMKLDVNAKYNNISGFFFNHFSIMAGILFPLK